MAVSIDIFNAASTFCSEIEAFMGDQVVLENTSHELGQMRRVFEERVLKTIPQNPSYSVLKKYRIASAISALKAVQLKIAQLLIKMQIFNAVPASDRKKLAEAEQKLQEVTEKGMQLDKLLQEYEREDELDRLIVDLMCEAHLEDAYRIDFQFQKRLSRRLENDYSVEYRVKDLETLSADYAAHCQKIYQESSSEIP